MTTNNNKQYIHNIDFSYLNSLEFNITDFQEDEIQYGSKTLQTGIIEVNTNNQALLSSFFKLNLSNEYPEFNLQNNSEVKANTGTIDKAEYDKDYYDTENIDTSKRGLLKPGVSIMIQKTDTGEWDIYPNPDAFNNKDASKNYSYLEDINKDLKKELQFKSIKNTISFGNKKIDDLVNMAYKGGVGTQNITSISLVNVLVLLSKIELNIPRFTNIKFTNEKGSQLTNTDGFVVIDIDDTGKITFRQAIKANIIGLPMGYENILQNKHNLKALSKQQMKKYILDTSSTVLMTYTDTSNSMQDKNLKVS